MMKIQASISLVLLFTTATLCYYQDGDVRLVGGSYQWEGRVEVYMSGVWGTITDSDWTNDDAVVVCRKLGHFRPGAIAYSNAYYGEGKGAIVLDSVLCTGNEYNLTECELENADSTSDHASDVGVACQSAVGSYREGDIRLVGGPHNWEGRVEIFWMGQWGTISDSSWSSNDARVVCRQLQHAVGSGVAVDCCEDFRQGNGIVFFQNVTCAGTENNITSCTTTINVNGSTYHEQDIGVRCEQGNEAREGELRLNRTIGTSGKAWEGRVEMFLFGQWGTICDDSSSAIDAEVVCRQLGYYVSGTSYRCCARFGQGSGPIHFRGLGCSGTEHRLTDCRNLTENCYHSEDWSALCRIDGPEELDVKLTFGRYGYVQVFHSGVWKPIADSGSNWNVINAAVVCRQLGYSINSVTVSASAYSIYAYYTTINNVMCGGTESKLTDCSYDFQYVYINRIFRMDCSYYYCSTGDIRLVGGDSEREGRVEVCSSNRWGTVCDKYWTDKHSAVLCRYMGYSVASIDLSHNSSGLYGIGAGPITMDYVDCNGTEDNLWKDCVHFTHYYGCSHEDDVGVQCQPARCSDGQLKLEGSEIEGRGRLEICSNHRWTTLYSSRFSVTNRRIACQELGFSSGGGYISAFGDSGGPRHSKYFSCSGSEERLSHCTIYTDTASRSAGYDIGIYCTFDSCEDREIKLVDGETELDGRIEMCYNGRWGTIGADVWTEINSKVVCNAFGYEISNIPADQLLFKAPSKPVYYHHVRCSSRDLKLLDCGFTRTTPDNSGLVDKRAIVRCNRPTCNDGDLRIVGGAAEGEGRLEVCFNRRWGTIDGDGWTHRDTEVACRQLGFSSSEVAYTKTSRYRIGSSSDLPAFITTVGCYGTEQHLTECSYHDFEYPSLSLPTMSHDVSITCTSSTMEGEDDNVNGTDSTKRTDEVTTMEITSTEGPTTAEGTITEISTTAEPVTADSGTKDAQAIVSDDSTNTDVSSIVANASLAVSLVLGLAVIVLIIVVVVIVRKRRKNTTVTPPMEQSAISNTVYFTNPDQEAVLLEENQHTPEKREEPVQENYEDVVVTNPIAPPPRSHAPKSISKTLKNDSAPKANPNPYEKGIKDNELPALPPTVPPHGYLNVRSQREQEQNYEEPQPLPQDDYLEDIYESCPT